ncbi:MAG: hypothetical protein EZS28_007845 [Streblomastix strix]|uniref:U3 small nucleolar RNA-associated protein 20 domain-containing protein n=1 Tax=Streblomastix strix TaxID=222440 RepID=A0A5J4WP70_9EUKA|nr:MAG: hypothetical protein EZS28_007845 [Streblomastix strix]
MSYSFTPQFFQSLPPHARQAAEQLLSKSSRAQKKQQLNRITASVSITKLIKKLPLNSGLINLHLPKLILILAEHLKSRNEDLRSIVRKTLTEMISILGCLYLGFIVQEMKRTLKRGYQVHVLTYTTRVLLQEIVKQQQLYIKQDKEKEKQKEEKEGDKQKDKQKDYKKQQQQTQSVQQFNVDYCVEEIADIAIKELFGSQSEEKEVQQLAGSFTEVKQSIKQAMYYQKLEIRRMKRGSGSVLLNCLLVWL